MSDEAPKTVTYDLEVTPQFEHEAGRDTIHRIALQGVERVAGENGLTIDPESLRYTFTPGKHVDEETDVVHEYATLSAEADVA